MAKELRPKKGNTKKGNTKKHVVVFQDEEGNVIKTSFVSHGEIPALPEMPEVKQELAHHRILFSGWDYDLKPITSNLVIRAIYEKVPKQYLVMYFHENGKVIGTETVTYGQEAKAPFHPKKPSTEEYEYIFAGWNTKLSSIQRDTMAKAIFVPRKRSYKITFLGGQGELLSQKTLKYGAVPVPPKEAQKPEDAAYYYHFAGWDGEISPVTGEKEYHAVFTPEHKIYHIDFYNEEQYLETKDYHYEDEILLPELKKKGYTLLWSAHTARVKKDAKITASWKFTNEKNKVITEKESDYRIINPSISSGTVSIVCCHDKKNKIIKIPEKVKVGDYYYRPVRIEKNAFSQCRKMNRLILPDTVEEIGERGLADCPNLTYVTIGKGLKKIGKYAFKGNRHLKEFTLKSKKIKSISPQAFDKMNSKITIKTPGLLPYKAEILFAKGVAGGNVILK